MSGTGDSQAEAHAIVDRLLPLPDRNLFGCGHAKDEANTYRHADDLFCVTCRRDSRRNYAAWRAGKITKPPAKKRRGAASENIANQRTILFGIVLAALENAPCPANAELNESIHANCTSHAVFYLTTLERKGLVKVTRFQRGREVSIPAFGISTAPYAGKRSPHWRSAPHAHAPAQS